MDIDGLHTVTSHDREGRIKIQSYAEGFCFVRYVRKQNMYEHYACKHTAER